MDFGIICLHNDNFRISGRLYDKRGNIRQWWDNVTIEKFESKAQCIEDQYSAYVLDQISMKINGRSTKVSAELFLLINYINKLI